ncbi:hypothetical protein FEM03_14630 [Phragmitibacter flavus]|uniref:DUF695 domain-containing protein n=1 Tax=Phragmitibacter flavus TaxID=2576071 RepID=A0A5R8KCC2_9BACT|nr:hypothetical protein [Phragmitibacter flavus]TLD69964.1 hypothetical protein FEM03_14630 [Phragmitibacter flavus]
MFVLYSVAGVVAALIGYVVWIEIRAQRMWVISIHTYEGFPLLLRHIDRLPFPSRRKELPTLSIITHTFSERSPDELPEPAYNDDLAELDLAMITVMRDRRIGSPVLIETFGGKCIYYHYVVDRHSAKRQFQKARLLFPDEMIDFDTREDPEWGFIDRYAKNYFP